ncbi:phosphopantetheine-binding protein [Legionella nagasakiensis]|uniref:phosphopantetheine-binding protein n=1 Tax=Legionella nagasakiensis TaxID=535290 RepID=UPI00105568BF|nr:phosphopantetheine-binding protein [Legionella nagasakiensis]
MLSERIEKALANVGLLTLPKDRCAKLAYSGLDSLLLALLIIELEREFKIRIPVVPLDKTRFESLHSIEAYLTELGVK